ncbi:hypothetical protein [Dyadobacter helix]|nr:hypothetical protein [Dyadobacter sp. CECT 9275]
MVLSCFDRYIKDIPISVHELYPIINDNEKWKEAHEQFTKISVFWHENENYEHDHYLRLAELVAKVTYNSSGRPAPFDSDSGYYIPGLALNLAEIFDDYRLKEEVKSVILLFNRHKKFRKNLATAKDFLLYKKIDDILWFDWDPIGINEIAPRDEYQAYIPEIFRLVKVKADKQEIADRLYKLECENIGVIGTMEKCLAIADKLLNLQ